MELPYPSAKRSLKGSSDMTVEGMKDCDALGRNALQGPAPVVSIIIPCYNGETFLRESVDSALGQSYASKEVIVVDDGSTDRSAAILETYGDRIRFVRQANAGPSTARNTGISVSRGHVVAFLDADDYWDSEFLAKMMAALDASGADFAYCGWQNVGLPGDRGKPFIPDDYSGENKVELLLRNARWPVHGALCRKDLITSAGSFDTSLPSAEDFDLWLRVVAFCKIVRVPEVLAYYRFHAGSQITKGHLRAARSVLYAQQKFVRAHPTAVAHLGRSKIAKLTYGELLNRGYFLYWKRDLESARAIFRMVMRAGYGSLRDWKYMLPALLPIGLHRILIRLLERHSAPRKQASTGAAKDD